MADNVLNNKTFKYIFRIKEDLEIVFGLTIDPVKMQLIVDPTQNNLPHWTELNTHQCPHCPLQVNENPHCPIAIQLVPLVKNFDHLVSYDEISVTVEDGSRTVSQKTTAQRGISSMMGLIIAASGCPHTDFFKTMVWFHLPFSTSEETLWRVTSSYMLAQYFKVQKQQSPDFAFEGLKKIYADIKMVNHYMAKRLTEACKNDSSTNALVILNLYTSAIPRVIDKSLSKIQFMFPPFN